MQLDEDIFNVTELSLLMQAEVAIEERREDFRRKEDKKQANGPCRILLNGYCGAGNIGADIRAGEIIRQLLNLFSPDQVRLFYTCQKPLNYEPFTLIEIEARQADANQFLSDYDGVIVVEGSVFKSNFSNVMAISFISALALAAAEGKLSVAYGAEAGQMSAEVSDFAVANSEGSLVVARSPESFDIISQDLGYRTELGADTAWTFEPSPSSVATELLKDAGWDGETDVVCIAPINPFCWPARPDFQKFAELTESGKHTETHCRSVFFYNDSEQAKTRYKQYLSAISSALMCHKEGSDFFPVLIGMESLDRKACSDLKQILGFDVPVFVSDEHSAHDVVSILRLSSLVISSRYHALVTSIPANVPGIGITIDERILNLMCDRGYPDSVLTVDDPELSEKLLGLMQKISSEPPISKAETGRFLVRQLTRVSDMGRALCREIEAKLPNVDVPNLDSEMETFLPSLSQDMKSLLEVNKLEAHK